VGLKNSELLDRLFLKDRRDPDLELRRVARAAALVYAFSVEGDETAEGAALAELAGATELVFHEKMADLLERGLAQKRGDQRAILPPAIAACRAAGSWPRSAPFRPGCSCRSRGGSACFRG